MRRRTFLLNISRGCVAALEALAQAVLCKHLAGAAIDVYLHEPDSNLKRFVSPHQNLPPVILTPHIGGSVMQAQEHIGRKVAARLARSAESGTTLGAVNLPPPYVQLDNKQGLHYVLHVHRHAPHVWRDVKRIFSDAGSNTDAQLLSTDSHLEFLLINVDCDVAAYVVAQPQALETSKRTQVF